MERIRKRNQLTYKYFYRGLDVIDPGTKYVFKIKFFKKIATSLFGTYHVGLGPFRRLGCKF